MGMTGLNQIGILPALVLTLGGLLVMRSDEEEKAQRRLLLYLLVVGNLLLLALFIAIQMTPPRDNRPYWQVSAVLMPTVIGVLALILLHGKHLATMSRGAQLLAPLLALALAGMVIAYWHTRFDMLAYSILPGVLVLALGWAVGRRFQKTAVFAAVLLLLALFGLNMLSNAPAGAPSPPPPWLTIPLSIGFVALPGMLVVIAAVLLTNSLQSHDGKPTLLPMLLALGLLGYLAYSIFWASVWSQTSDGLEGALPWPAALVAVGAGMVIAVALNGWRRGAGLLFAVLVPLLLYQAFEQGWRVSYHDITDARAERIVQALTDYHQREGVYPPTLDALTPRYLLRVPQPVELRGETWCYQGGDDFYQLAIFFREFFSMPVELQVYATVGEPDGAWACEEQLAVMK
jgi:MFS family permease